MNTKEIFKEQNIENNDNFDSLTNDVLFKESLGNPHNRRALEHLLEDYYNYEVGFLKNKLAINYESHLEKTRLKRYFYAW